MSSISFTKVNDPNSEEVCGICFDPLPKDYFAHNGGKNNTRIHPLDEKCLKTWLAANPGDPTCPTCRAKVNTQSLFSWKEKLVIEFKNTSFAEIANTLPVVVGATGGTAIVFGAIIADTLSLTTGLKVVIAIAAVSVGILASAVTIVGQHRGWELFRQETWVEATLAQHNLLNAGASVYS